jgi:hypothetical protein
MHGKSQDGLRPSVSRGLPQRDEALHLVDRAESVCNGSCREPDSKGEGPAASQEESASRWKLVRQPSSKLVRQPSSKLVRQPSSKLVRQPSSKLVRQPSSKQGKQGGLRAHPAASASGGHVITTGLVATTRSSLGPDAAWQAVTHMARLSRQGVS